MSNPLISIQDLRYTYSLDSRFALDGLDLEVEQGEFVAIIGENGAGKTTLLKNLVGLLRPTSGSIRIQGQDTGQLAVSELATHVGFVLQNPDQQLFAQTVEEEIAFGPRNLGLADEEIRTRVEEAITSTGLGRFRGEYPPALARGDRAKVVIASVLAMQPGIVILDEPTTGQDYKGCHQIMGIARELRQKGHTLLVVTHDMELIAEYTERTIVLHHGKMLLDGKTSTVFGQTEILHRTQVEPPQITQLSRALPVGLGLPALALTVEQLGQAIVTRKNEIEEATR